jgi:3-hydroxybutyryl-CoA dehydrogenase
MKISIIGSGAMGSGIGQVAAMSGCEVMLYDVNRASLDKAYSSIDASIQKYLAKGALDVHAAKAIMGRIYCIEKLETIAESDVIIEAIVEDLDVKKSILGQIEAIVRPDAIIATNTSSLSVTAIASSLKNPKRCVGIHFFNPAVIMQLVEIIPAVQTSPEVVTRAEDIISNWGKRTILAKDTPGFVVNKVARPFYSEAIRIYEEGIATMEIIDGAMKGLGFRMGPFELMDFIGHDVNYRVTESVWKSFYYDARYKPSLSQLRLLEAGHLGRKSEKGFYTYPMNAVAPIIEKTTISEEVALRILSMIANEAADTVHLGIATIDDIDTAVTLGLNYPKPIFAWMEEIGLDTITTKIDSLYQYYREDRYRTSPFLWHLSKK